MADSPHVYCFTTQRRLPLPFLLTFLTARVIRCTALRACLTKAAARDGGADLAFDVRFAPAAALAPGVFAAPVLAATDFGAVPVPDFPAPDFAEAPFLAGAFARRAVDAGSAGRGGLPAG